MKHFFDRGKMRYFPLRERLSKVDITKTALMPGALSEGPPEYQSPELVQKVRSLAVEITRARESNRQVICAFGAHVIKNGLGPLLGEMLRKGWFTHLASNGAAVIHDWEFAWLGKSSEDVRENVASGRFGTWEETGFYINLALAVGAYQGLGYAASVGDLITRQGLVIPGQDELRAAIAGWENDPSLAAAALDLHELIGCFNVASGFLSVSHPFRDYSLLAAAQDAGRPFTCHPMFGHDIIYTHRTNRGAVIGRAAERDFLEYAASVEGLEGGIYLSVGSAVMSPMIFEKSLSMVRNVQANGAVRNCGIYVVDLGAMTWDWSKGEPPMDNPAYYHRYMKTFNRMGCKAEYMTADNRDFFVSLYYALTRNI